MTFPPIFHSVFRLFRPAILLPMLGGGLCAAMIFWAGDLVARSAGFESLGGRMFIAAAWGVIVFVVILGLRPRPDPEFDIPPFFFAGVQAAVAIGLVVVTAILVLAALFILPRVV